MPLADQLGVTVCRMRWPVDLPPVEWPEPLLGQDGRPMRVSQATKDAAYAAMNSHYRRMQVRAAWTIFAVSIAVIVLRQQRR